MKMQYFTGQHAGQVRKVLFEKNEKNARLNDSVGHGMMEGFTDNYIKITTPYKAEWKNEIVDWKI
jgi:threonylcarbamoyladenosine tRNA methylthiotransferase MtaB